MSVDVERARVVFAPDALGWVLDRLHARLERGRPLDARLRLKAPTAQQREEFLRFTGRPPSHARSISIEPAELAGVLARAGIAPDLESLVTALNGPVVDRKAAAAAEQAAWHALHQRVRDEATAIHARLGAWVDDLEARGLLRRLAKDTAQAERLARQATAVLRRLPARGVPLAQLAATTIGDSHALDDGLPLATLMLRAIEHLTGTGLPREDRGVEERRALWASAGVLRDELSRPALAVGVRPGGDGLLGRTLRAHADAGEPCRITLRLLVRHAADWTALAGTVVAVCENPTVVAAAADRLGAACPPLLCTDGQPSAAVQTLLARLADAGAELRFHTDFDRGGLRIGNLLADRFAARPWRMGRADYEAAVDRGLRERPIPVRGDSEPSPGKAATPTTPDVVTTSTPLSAPPEPASWDAHLAAAMIERGIAVHEEQLLDILLADLATLDLPLTRRVNAGGRSVVESTSASTAAPSR